jgi:putative ABC transport system substrate-binding protein
MKRRTFVGILASTAVLPFSASAQQPARVPRIGILALTQADADALGKVLRQSLRDAGYIDGQSVVFESRSADGNAATLPAMAEDLVRSKVDVIVALYTPSVLAAKRATGDTPIVAAVMADPVGTGLVDSLSRPGGNVTGLSNMGPETAGKCVDLFRDMMPSLRRVGVMGNPADPFTKPFLEQIRLAAHGPGIEIAPIAYARGTDDLEAAFAAVTADRPDALIVQGVYSPKAVADFAIKLRLPSASIVPAFARAGGLMSYGADVPELFQRSASYVQRILRGSKPAELPVEQPTKFNLAINLKTAKEIGLAIPGAFLLRAEEVIE